MLVKLKANYGFTLVELAMVLFIVSLMLGGLMLPLSTRLEQENRANTINALNEIKETLLGYAVINGRLPCPDCADANAPCNAVPAANINDGIEDRAGATPNRVCTTNVGNLPWVDLQVSAFDAWEHYYTYRVTPEFSRESNAAPCGTPALGVSFEICTAGDIDIYDTYANPFVAPPTVADNVPVIIVSHGADFYTPAQTNQQVENYERDPVNPDSGNDILTTYTPANYTNNIFVLGGFRRDNSLSPPTQFDDIIMWISPNLLMNRMITSGRLP
jgi:prepilin-type N-terminal cleavage/methylation domain-containing protein